MFTPFWRSTLEKRSWPLIAAIFLPMLFALLLGYFMIYGRISDIYFSVVTLVVTLILEKAIRSTSGDQYTVLGVRLNGQNGIPTVPSLHLPVEFKTELHAIFYLAAGVLVLVYVGLRLLLTTQFGRALVGIRENPRRMELLGYDVRRYRLGVFVLCSGIAALAGVLARRMGQLRGPADVRSEPGGAGGDLGDRGRPLDAAWTDRRCGGRAISRRLARYAGGRADLAHSRPRADVGRAWSSARACCRAWASLVAYVRDRLTRRQRDMSAPDLILETRGLERRFGGVRAVAGVDFKLERGELRCLIGPNGAGKSTFFKMLTGQMRPTAGQILFEGREIGGAQPHEIGRLGIGIKNQVPDVFDGLERARERLAGGQLWAPGAARG